MSAVTEETSRGQRTTSMLMITVSLSLFTLSITVLLIQIHSAQRLQMSTCLSVCPPACLSVLQQQHEEKTEIVVSALGKTQFLLLNQSVT